MILGKTEIEKLIKANNIIEGYDATLSQNNPAKVELRLGEKCYLSSQEKDIIDFSVVGTVKIKPNDIFLYQTLEKVNIPNNIAGHLSLKMGYTARGLLMSNQTQVDPGYNNYLFGMLYNLSDSDIELKYEDSIVTLELYQTKNATTTTYSGNMEKISFEGFCKKRIGSSLAKMSASIDSQVNEITELSDNVKASTEKNERHLNFFMTIVGIATLAITIISIVIAIIAAKPDADVARLSEKVEYQQQIIDNLKDDLIEQSKEIDDLIEQIEKFESSMTSAQPIE